MAILSWDLLFIYVRIIILKKPNSIDKEDINSFLKKLIN